MARPRTFNELAVLDAAASLFRRLGYAATSTERMCEATGLRRSSLYNAFDSKEELFFQALERYVAATGEAQASALEESSTLGLDRVRTLLSAILAEEIEAAAAGHAAGCMILVARSTPDLTTRDPRIAPLLDSALDRELELLRHAVRIGRQDGSIRADVRPHDAAQLIVTIISGLRATAQAGASPDELRRVATLGLTALQS